MNSSILKKILVAACIISVSTQAHAQYYPTRLRIDSAGRSYIFGVTDKKTTVSNQRWLYWFKSGRIHSTLGGYYGKLLHGRYLVTDQEENLLEQGHFRKGTKTGTWKTWHPNGFLQSIRSKRLYLTGAGFHIKEYDSSGRLVKKGIKNKNGFTGFAVEGRADSTYIKQYKKNHE